MVELVDTYALGAYAFRCAGSNPVPGTTNTIFVEGHKNSLLTGVFFMISNNTSSILYILECHIILLQERSVCNRPAMRHLGVCNIPAMRHLQVLGIDNDIIDRRIQNWR